MQEKTRALQQCRRARALFFFILFFAPFFLFAQDGGRGSIPQVLARPLRGEAARLPVDTVIGEMGQGSADPAAYAFVRQFALGLLSGNAGHPALASVNPQARESYLHSMGQIGAQGFRIGSGRQEPDGSVSFLIRFIGRDDAILGEVYINNRGGGEVEVGGGAVSGATSGWLFEELLLEPPVRRGSEPERRWAAERVFLYERFF